VRDPIPDLQRVVLSMAVKFDTLKPGDVLYDCHREKLGNTTMSALGIWHVYIKVVSLPERKALISWNGNPDRWVPESYFLKSIIRKSPPEWSYRGLEGDTCYLCKAKKADGHLPTCKHPKAKTASKGK
jgi:hypothetical protein